MLLLQKCLARYFGCAQARFSPLRHFTSELRYYKLSRIQLQAKGHEPQIASFAPDQQVDRLRFKLFQARSQAG